MEFEKSVSFKNWTTTKFEGIFDGTTYTFEAGGTYNVPASLALHFAKHLAHRELHALGTAKGDMLTESDVNEYMDKCFPVKPTHNPSVNSFERMDVVDTEATDAEPVEEPEQKEVEEEETDVTDQKNNAGAPVFKKPGRPRKDAQYV